MKRRRGADLLLEEAVDVSAMEQDLKQIRSSENPLWTSSQQAAQIKRTHGLFIFLGVALGGNLDVQSRLASGFVLPVCTV